MTIHESEQKLLIQLISIYEKGEANAIKNMVMEKITTWKKIDRVVNKNLLLSASQIELLRKYTEELLMHKPVQYVLGEAWFAGMKFHVNENVLIPRPETEELVDWAFKEFDGRWPITEGERGLTILDIGTGSGCIPISLKKKLPFAKIYSCDVSEAALEVAKKNAEEQLSEIHFINIDFLEKENWKYFPRVDLIISNPPYIPLSDKGTMMKNVTDHEPHLALFVENENPLIFYKAIALFAKEKLETKGKIFLEIHENQGSNVMKLFSFYSIFSCEIKKDMQGKERMLKATRLL